MIKCIIVDDEPKAIEVIDIHASKVPSIEVTGKFTNPRDALNFLRNNYTDVVFLDINMPEISGLEFIAKLDFEPYIIFTTAYSEYAIESYNYEAVDYLLKPIEFARFYKSIQKVEKRISNSANGKIGNTADSFFIKDGYRRVRIIISKIKFVKGEGNYLQIHCDCDKIMARMTFNQLLEQLPENSFVRIHNCYVINSNVIDKIENNHVFIQGTSIPIGVKYKDNFEKMINQI